MPFSQSSFHFRLEIQLPLLSILFFACATITQAAPAVQWPVQQSPNEAPVPQYVPRNSASRASQTRQPVAAPASQLPDFFDRSSSQPAIPGDQLLAPNPLAKSAPTSGRPVRIQPRPVQLPPTKSNTPVVTPNRLPTPQSVIEPAIPLSTPPQLSKPAKQATAKKKGPVKHKPLLDEAIYRDRSPFPIDPRKPCSQCTQGHGQCTCGIGNHGRPYQEKLYGGCRCDSCRSTKHPDFSVHWPRPFSAKLDQRHPEWEAARHSGCPQKRIVDVFDSLSTLKLLNYKRTDNGYCGPGSDPYGCLGESKLRAAAFEQTGNPAYLR